MQELRDFYVKNGEEIRQRLADFSKLREADEKRLFYELCFCIMAVQTSGIKSWEVAKRLKEENFLDNGTSPERFLREGYIRFHNNKSNYLLEARKNFINVVEKLRTEEDPKQMREWLVENVKGFGMKEASHFLRNIGRTQELAILDRHILRNMERHGFIEEIPKSLTKKKYLEIEQNFQKMAKTLNMKPAELDLLLWAKEVGVVFK